MKRVAIRDSSVLRKQTAKMQDGHALFWLDTERLVGGSIIPIPRTAVGALGAVHGSGMSVKGESVSARVNANIGKACTTTLVDIIQVDKTSQERIVVGLVQGREAADGRSAFIAKEIGIIEPSFANRCSLRRPRIGVFAKGLSWLVFGHFEVLQLIHVTNIGQFHHFALNAGHLVTRTNHPRRRAFNRTSSDLGSQHAFVCLATQSTAFVGRQKVVNDENEGFLVNQLQTWIGRINLLKKGIFDVLVKAVTRV